MPAGGYGAAGFGGGFGRGLANVLAQTRGQTLDKEAQQAQRTLQANLALLQPAIQFGIESRDFTAVERLLSEIDPDFAKTAKKRGFSFTDLGPMLQQVEPRAGAPGAVQAGAPQATDLATGEIPLLPTEGVPALGVSGRQAPVTSFLGTPVLTPEQRAERQAQTEATGLQTTIDARRRIAEQLGMEPAQALDFALYGNRPPLGTQALRYGGVVKGDQVGEGATDTSGRALDPNQFYRVQIQPTGELMYIPTTAPGAVGGGAALNRAAIRLGFRTAAEVPAERREELETMAQTIAAEEAAGTTTARVGAEQTARFLPPSEAAALQTSYGITEQEAASLQRVPLTPPQIQAATESYLLEKDVQRARELFERVWPREGSPERRRLSLMTLQRRQHKEFIELMSLLRRMPLRLAVMTQGSRPSDVDREVFDTAFPTTASDNWSVVQVPSSYEAGVQLLDAAVNLATTSRESIGIVPLAERGARPQGAEASTAPRGGAAGAPSLDTPIYIDPATGRPTLTPPGVR